VAHNSNLGIKQKWLKLSVYPGLDDITVDEGISLLVCDTVLLDEYLLAF
jgi:hypothetical protein